LENCFHGFDFTLKTREGLGLGSFRIAGLTRKTHVDTGCHPHEQTSTAPLDISLCLQGNLSRKQPAREENL